MKFAMTILVFFATVALTLLTLPECRGQKLVDVEQVDEGRFETIAQRYWTILKRRPRRGTSFDLWYRHYLDAGKLDELLELVTKETEQNSKSAGAQVLLGLVRERRGDDELAVDCYAAAVKLAPKDYYPVSLLGTLHARRFEFDESATALSEAVELDPPRDELLEMYKHLGRMQLRKGEIEQALKTWERVAKEFPNDRRVLRELATLLASEDQFDEAIRRWKQVLELSQKDLYQKLKSRIEIAQLYARSGKRQSAVLLFNQVLDDVKPDSWAAQDVRQRIEDTFLKHNDLKGLIDYCEQRLIGDPDDLESMQLLARTLARSRQHDEALATYRKAMKLAPGRRDIREAMIDQFVRAKQFANAIEQCEHLVEQHPTDVELILMLGELHLKAVSGSNHTQGERDEAEVTAAEIWERIATIRPEDANLAVQVAEACRRSARIARRDSLFSFTKPAAVRESSPLVRTAEKYYREAIRRNPNEPQYHEYLGEFLHSVGRGKEAVAVWSQLVQSPNDTPSGWHRLAEVYSGFGYLDDAIAASKKSLQLESDNFEFHDFQIRLLLDKQEYDEAVARLVHLDRLAADPLMEEKAMSRRVSVFSESGRTNQEIDKLRKTIATGNAAVKNHWLLGRLLTDRWRFSESATSLESALKLAPDNARIMRDYAIVLERTGDTAAAVKLYRQLAKNLSKDRSTYYEKIVNLELAQGHAQEAIQAADQLAKLSPSNLDGYLLQARVSFRLGETEEGLRTLRRAVRIAPRDIPIRDRLAQALSDHRQYQEAVEHYWRCFELADDLGEKLSFVSAMADVSIKSSRGRNSDKSNDYEQFVEKLLRLRDRHEEPRALTLCVVEAYRMNNRYKDAQQELQNLLATYPEDLDVLQLTVNLAASQKDWRTAVEFQKRIVSIDGSRDNLRGLSQFHVRIGDRDEAAEVWKRILQEMDDDGPIVSVIDDHLRKGKFAEALQRAEWGLEIAPQNWRLMFRCGFAHYTLENYEEAAAQFSKFQAVVGPAVRKNKPLPQQRPYGGLLGSSTQRVYVSSSRGFRVPSIHPSSIQRLPAFREIYDSQLAYTRLLTVKSAKDRLKGATSSRKKSYLRQLASAVQLPTNLNSARANSVVAMLVLAQRLRREDDWIDNMRNEAQEDLSKLRELVLVCAATGKLAQHQDVSDLLAKRAPDDPLPHVAKFYLMSNATTFNALSTVQKQQRLQSLRESFQWVDRHRPDLRSDVLYNCVLQLTYLGDASLAASLVTDEMNAARRVQDLGNLPYLVFQIDVPGFQKAFLNCVVTLANNESASSVNQLATILQISLSQRLFQQPLVGLDDQPLNSIVSIVDRYLEFAGQSPVNSQAVAPIIRSSQAGAQFSRLAQTSTRPRMSSAQQQARQLQTQAVNAQLQALAAEYQNVSQQIANSKAGGKSAAQLAKLSQRRSQLLSAIQTMARRRQQSNVPFFPAPNNYLSVQAHVILEQLVGRLKLIKKSDMLLQRLSKRAAESQGKIQQTYRMARISVLWWLDQRPASLKLLREFCNDVPDDHRLRFTLAQASVVASHPGDALEQLNKVKSTANASALNSKTVLAQQVTGLRNSIWQSMARSGDEQILKTVLIELNSSQSPELSVLFTDLRQLARRGTTTTRVLTTRSTTARSTRSGLRSPPPRARSSRTTSAKRTSKPVFLITKLLAYARSRELQADGAPQQLTELERLATANLNLLDHENSNDADEQPNRRPLQELDQLATIQYTKHPQNVELAAFLALVRFERGRAGHALFPALRYYVLTKDEKSTAQKLESALVTAACLKNPETRELGYRLSLRISLSSQSQIASSELREVLSAWTAAYVKDGRTKDAEQLVLSLFTTIDGLQSPKTGGPARKLYAMADLMPAIHATLLPLAVDELAQRYVKHATMLPMAVDELAQRYVKQPATLREPYRFAFPVEQAVSKAAGELPKAARQAILKRLLAMLFPFGADQDAAVLWWQSGRGSVMTGSLGKTVIDLAKSTGDLPQLRAQWDQHPLADSANLHAMRLEAAVALGDEETTEKLLSQISAVKQRTGNIVPVWSDRCRKLAFPDRTVAEWVLSQGVGASVILSPGGIIMQAADLPNKDISIRSIVLTAKPNVTDESIENLSQLNQLETLDLSKTPITDAGLKHLSGLPNLQSLSLSSTNVTDAGLKHLANLKKLTFLRIRKTKVTESGIEYLKKTLPKCRVQR